MGSSFDLWKKDPFFHVAEEVQESADRMESTYRTWIHAAKDTTNMWNPDELRRDLLTTLGTAKWQLEEFEREVRWSYSKSSSDSARNRHRDFITAIEDKIRKIEHSLNESNPIGSKESKPWVCLDEGEKDELALFLSGMPEEEGEKEELSLSLSRGHRRAASADIGYCKILVSDDHVEHSNPMHKVSSLSGFLSSMETISKWKLNVLDHHKQTHCAIFPNVQFNKGNNATLDSSDECYDKQHYGWCGTIQRQLQRSQYQMQYTGFVRVTALIVFLLCLIGLIAFCTK